MSSGDENFPSRSTQGDLEAFLARVARTPAAGAAGRRGRLIFAMDATASREPTWDQACQLQGEMFSETAALGGLDVQLCHYRGFRQFSVSGWQGDSAGLLERMSEVRCAGGATQIARVLQHVLQESGRETVNALVFVGDCVEESVDALAELAGQLGLRGVPAFMFHEGGDRTAERAFREIAQLSGGAFARFDAGSAAHLRELLRAVAVFAAGGRRALADLGERDGGAARALTHQIGGRMDDPDTTRKP